MTESLVGWQPIATVPDATNVLLWWTPVDGNKNAETHVIGHVSIHERGKYWNGSTGEYEDLARITHWMPLPDPPSVNEPERDAESDQGSS